VTEVSGGLVIPGHDAGDHQGPGTWMLGHRSRTTGSGVSQRSLVRRNGSVGRSDERAPAGGVTFLSDESGYSISGRLQPRNTKPPSTRRIVPVM